MRNLRLKRGKGLAKVRVEKMGVKPELFPCRRLLEVLYDLAGNNLDENKEANLISWETDVPIPGF